MERGRGGGVCLHRDDRSQPMELILHGQLLRVFLHRRTVGDRPDDGRLSRATLARASTGERSSASEGVRTVDGRNDGTTGLRGDTGGCGRCSRGGLIRMHVRSRVRSGARCGYCRAA